MGLKSRLSVSSMVACGLIKSFRKTEAQISTEPIDFVVTWVDGNDPAWLKERFQCLGIDELSASGNGTCRYRDWSSFRYWFRAVETFAPWVRYVHLVTWGHVPEWLKLDCPKLRIVNHKDYIPAEYLPTFNSIPIELNMFRIPGLSECFVYFNDDMLLSRPVTPEDFFLSGRPKHTAIAYPYVNRDNEIPTHILFNTYGIANKMNDIQSCIAKYPEKWFSYKYGRLINHNLEAWRNAGLPSMYFSHVATPYCKSTMEKTWKKYEKMCTYSSSCRIRDIRQITHQIYSIEDILNGNFEPCEADWGTLLAIDDIQGIRAAYQMQQTKMICLFDRDNLTNEEIDKIDQELIALFGRILPTPSSFEKT